MKLGIAGTRDFADRFAPWIDSGAEIVERALAVDALPSPDAVDAVVSGEAVGPDRWGESWADARGITVHHYSVRWDEHEDDRKPAPYYRNRAMAEEGDRLLAFWDGKSGGTSHMIDKAMEAGMIKHVVRMDDEATRHALLAGDDAPVKVNTYDPNPSQDLSKVAKTVE